MKKIGILLSACALMASTAFGGGYYMEYKMTSIDNGTSTDMGSMKMYAQDGNSRVEVSMNIPGMPARTQTSLHLESNPDVSYMINEADKTYSELKVSEDPQEKDMAKEEYVVTVLGTEKVNGYNSKHVKISRKSDGKELMQMWTTTEISNWADLSKIKSRYTGKSNMFDALTAADAAGFPVRIQSSERGHQMQLDLVKVEARSLQAALFSLDGYTKSNSPAFDPAKMHDMSPEDRAKMLQDMMKTANPANAQPH